MSLFPTERSCAICGKEFMGYEQWVFKRGDEWFCSWGCLRQHDQKTRRKRLTARRLDRRERSEVAKLLEMGVNPQRIAYKVGVSVQAIMYYKQKAEA